MQGGGIGIFMNIHNASLTISAVRPGQYPSAVKPEFALAGRSNVGKSSFVNKLLNRTKLARTSSHPGKTATINFYNIDDQMYFVDLPGYGYAEVSREERAKWSGMIETYLNSRETLVQTILLVDSRHKPTEDDILMFNWIKHRHGRAVVIATKYDKLAKTKAPQNIQLIREKLTLDDGDILIPFSSETGLGREDAWKIISELGAFECPV